MALLKENKKDVIGKYKITKNDTGSSEVQVALLTERINGLEEHFKKNIKDNHSRFGLIRMVEKRKKLLSYIRKQDPEQYQKIISRLELRK